MLVDHVFDILHYFASYHDPDIQQKAVNGLGFVSVAHPDVMLTERMRTLYGRVLQPPSVLNSVPGFQIVRPKFIREFFLIQNKFKIYI